MRSVAADAQAGSAAHTESPAEYGYSTWRPPCWSDGRHEALRRRPDPSYPPAPRRRAVRALDGRLGLGRARRPARHDAAGRRRPADRRVGDLAGRRADQRRRHAAAACRWSAGGWRRRSTRCRRPRRRSPQAGRAQVTAVHRLVVGAGHLDRGDPDPRAWACSSCRCDGGSSARRRPARGSSTPRRTSTCSRSGPSPGSRCTSWRRSATIPPGAWRARDPEVVTALARLELRDCRARGPGPPQLTPVDPRGVPGRRHEVRRRGSAPRARERRGRRRAWTVVDGASRGPARRRSRRSRRRSSGRRAPPRDRAVSTARSSSRQEISKSSRIETWEASSVADSDCPVPVADGAHGVEDAQVLGDHVACPRRSRTGSSRPLDARPGRRRAGTLDPQGGGGLRALGTPVAVRAVGEAVADPGVDDQQDQPGVVERQLDGRDAAVGEVEQEGVARLGQHGHGLVHAAGGRADVVVLGPDAGVGEPTSPARVVEVEVQQAGDGRRRPRTPAPRSWTGRRRAGPRSRSGRRSRARRARRRGARRRRPRRTPPSPSGGPRPSPPRCRPPGRWTG